MSLFYVFFLCSLLQHGTSLQTSCSTDSNCNYGICTSVGPSKYCSCLSGFGGSTCLERPSSNCSYDAVTATSSTFQPNATLSYQYPNLTIEIITNLEQTMYQNASMDDTKISSPPYSQQLTVVFGNGSFLECNFPNNQVDWMDLEAQSGDCKDRIKLMLPWNETKSRCGFSSSSPGVYDQAILVQRRYLLDNSRGYNITRTDSRIFEFRIIFPSETDLSTASVIVITSLPSVTPTSSPSPSPGILQTYTTVELRIEGVVEEFDTQAFLQAMADILNVDVTRLVVVSVRSGSVIVEFEVYDTPESSSAEVTAQFVEIIESGDPVLTGHGITVLNVTVDTSTAANFHGNDNSSNNNLDTILLAVLIPVGFIVLVTSIVAVSLLARRLKNGPTLTLPETVQRQAPAPLPPSPITTSPPKPPKNIYESDVIPSPKFRRGITKNLFEQPTYATNRERQGSIDQEHQRNQTIAESKTRSDSETESVTDEETCSVTSVSTDYFEMRNTLFVIWS